MPIQDIRKEIDAIDDEIMSLVLKRVEISKGTKTAKEERGMPILDTAREREVLSRWVSFAEVHGLDPDVLSEMCLLLMAHSKAVQKDL